MQFTAIKFQHAGLFYIDFFLFDSCNVMRVSEVPPSLMSRGCHTQGTVVTAEENEFSKHLAFCRRTSIEI